MPDQLDLFAAITPPPAPPPPPVAGAGAASRPVLYPWPHAHLRRPALVQALADVSTESLAALAAILLLEELPPIVAGALPRVAVDRAGWNHAMEHRMHLTHQQLAGTLTPGDAGALAALRYVELQQVDGWNTGPIIITATGYDHLANALAGLRCAAMENQDG